MVHPLTIEANAGLPYMTNFSGGWNAGWLRSLVCLKANATAAVIMQQGTFDHGPVPLPRLQTRGSVF